MGLALIFEGNNRNLNKSPNLQFRYQRKANWKFHDKILGIFFVELVKQQIEER